MFVVLAGTNNLSREPPDSPEKTALGIEAIVGCLTKQCPESQVFLLTLPPNGYAPQSPLRKRVIETNRLLKTLAVRAQIEVVAAHTFPRTDFKARRVIENREVFRDMQHKLEAGPRS